MNYRPTRLRASVLRYFADDLQYKCTARISLALRQEPPASVYSQLGTLITLLIENLDFRLDQCLQIIVWSFSPQILLFFLFYFVLQTLPLLPHSPSPLLLLCCPWVSSNSCIEDVSINAAFLLRSFHYNYTKNLPQAALGEYILKAVYFLACFSMAVGGLGVLNWTAAEFLAAWWILLTQVKFSVTASLNYACRDWLLPLWSMG